MMGRELALLFGFGSFFFMIAMIVIGGAMARRKQAAQLDARRLDLLEQALQHPSLDEATRAELLRTMAAGREGPQPAARPTADRSGNWWLALWYGAGWLLFVFSGCMLGANALELTPGLDSRTFVPLTILGFAMLTLPLALGELQARRARSAPAER